MIVELAFTVRGIDGRDHAVASEAFGDEGFLHQGMDHRCRIGQAGGLDQYPRNRRDLPPRRTLEQSLERPHQIALDAAADASRVEHHQSLVDLLHQMVIDPDFAELVDQNGRSGHIGLTDDVIEQRRLAGPEEARKEDYRDTPVSVLGCMLSLTGLIVALDGAHRASSVG